RLASQTKRQNSAQINPAKNNAATATGKLPPVEKDQQRARQLLSNAQAAIARGNFEQARSLALQAQELNVPYGIHDLQPQQVLAQIDRATNNVAIAKSGSKMPAATGTLPNVKSPTKELPTDAPIATPIDHAGDN